MTVEERIAEIRTRVEGATMRDKGPDVLWLLKYVGMYQAFLKLNLSRFHAPHKQPWRTCRTTICRDIRVLLRGPDES